jgi:hypothetical protein
MDTTFEFQSAAERQDKVRAVGPTTTLALGNAGNAQGLSPREPRPPLHLTIASHHCISDVVSCYFVKLGNVVRVGRPGAGCWSYRPRHGAFAQTTTVGPTGQPHISPRQRRGYVVGTAGKAHVAETRQSPMGTKS